MKATYNPANTNGQAFVVEGAILGIAALIGAIAVAIGGVLYFLFRGSKVEAPFLPSKANLDAAHKATDNGFQALAASVLWESLGYIPATIDWAKMACTPARSESEARDQLRELGITPPSDFGARWDKLVKCEQERQKSATPQANPGLLDAVKSAVGDVTGCLKQEILTALSPAKAAAAASSAAQPAQTPAPATQPSPAKDVLPPGSFGADTGKEAPKPEEPKGKGKGKHAEDKPADPKPPETK